MAVAARFALVIGLGFHHHTPAMVTSGEPAHQQAAHQLGRHLLGGTLEEGQRQRLFSSGGDGTTHGAMMLAPGAIGMGAPDPALITIPVSIGELIDKITILEIKAERLGGAGKTNVERELALLNATLAASGLAIDPALLGALKAVNLELWRIEDEIREQERRQDFGDAFIALARAVYVTNDRRAALKRQLNERHGSALIEEKSYRPY